MIAETAQRVLSLPVRAVDLLIRRMCGICTFTDDPRCVVRIAVETSDTNLVLSDKVAIVSGDVILELHLWNEHVPRIPKSGHDLAWGREAAHRAGTSLTLLAGQLAEGKWPEVKAIRGEMLVAGDQRCRLCERVLRRYGFDVFRPETPRRWRDRLRYVGESLLAWSLAWTFNPVGSLGRGMRFRRIVAWISRRRLVEQYAPQFGRSLPGASHSRTEDLPCSG